MKQRKINEIMELGCLMFQPNNCLEFNLIYQSIEKLHSDPKVLCPIEKLHQKIWLLVLVLANIPL